MRVMLINPPFDPEESVGESSSVRFVLNITPPLGLAYLGAVLERAGHHVKIVDYTSRFPYAPLTEIIKDFEPDLIGLTSTTPSFESARRLSEELRKIIPRTPLILGGAHITCAPESAMESGLFEVGVIGEGEETVVELTDHIRGHGFAGLDGVKGIIYRDGGGFRRTPPRPFIEDLDSLPFPAYHLLPSLTHYHPTPASYRRLPVGILMTSRGCPFKCTFCDRSIFGNTTRFQSPERVLAEVEWMIRELGAKEIRFFDDTFTLKRERAAEICAGLRERNLNLPWTCLTAVKAITPDLLKKMKSAGCWQVLYGLESGDDRMLGLLGKGNTVKENRDAVGWAKDAGLEVRGDFIVGTPGETMESLEKTLNFTLESGLDYAHFNKFTPFPGTELYKRLVADGYSFDFSHGCSILDHGALLFIPRSLDREEYRRWLDRAFKKFYLRPSHIGKRLLAIRTWTQFRGQVRGAFAIAGL
ncbi:MAG: radical SAM protein [Candidatus Euphemobacter frigidus]|nr:radical SAM protein [Candidatus Euphemobacter frigidus]